MTYLFALGSHPHISTAEILAVFRVQDIPILSVVETGTLLLVETKAKIDCAVFMARLGGTIYIAEQVGKVPANPEKAVEEVARHLQTQMPKGKITFSLHGKNIDYFALKVKRVLKEKGIAVRYVEANNTATITHNDLLETNTDLTIADDKIFATVAVQPIDELSARDYGKPGVDSRSGMLPPKLARMMINIAEVSPAHTLLDPFCGSGVLLMEAAVIGFKEIIGSDISEKAVEDTKKNLAWLQERNLGDKKQGETVSEVFLCDAASLQKKIKPNSVDTIVCEPFMGKPLHGNEAETFLKKQMEELATLYEAAFCSFRDVLTKSGVVVFLVPRFSHNKKWLRIDMQSKIEALGFTMTPLSKKAESLLYWREGQYVGREIWRFVKS